MAEPLSYELVQLHLPCNGSMGNVTILVKGAVPEQGPITLAYPYSDDLAKLDFMFRDDMEIMVVGRNTNGRHANRYFRERTMVRKDGRLVITPRMLG
jgi:hypothetical protein